MNVSLDLRQTLWTRRFKAQFELSTNTRKNLIPTIANVLVKIISDNLADTAALKTITNFQGILDAGSNVYKLLSLRGLITLDQQPVPYEIGLDTSFNRYEGRHQTINNIKETRTNLPAELQLLTVTETVGLTPHELIFSVEHLRSRAFIPILGYFPTPEERLSIIVGPSTFTLLMSAENLPSKDSLPFYDHTILTEISKNLESIIGTNIIREYQSRIRL